MYTNYYYRIDVTDGAETTVGTVNSVRTKCSGKGLTCTDAKSCPRCNESGNCLHGSFKDLTTTIKPKTNWECAGCGITLATTADPTVQKQCNYCGFKGYWSSFMSKKHKSGCASAGCLMFLW